MPEEAPVTSASRRGPEASSMGSILVQAAKGGSARRLPGFHGTGRTVCCGPPRCKSITGPRPAAGLTRDAMELPSALLLSRIQFAWVVAWHILLPAFTIGLACWIATLE